MKGKAESSERVLNEIKASRLSNNEFKTLFIGSLKSPLRTTKNYRENTRNLLQKKISIEMDIETINKGQEEMNNTISELKNTVEVIKSRLDEAED